MGLLTLTCVLFAMGIGLVVGQDPTVKISDTSPPSVNGTIKAKRDQDILMDCYVENLPEDTLVRWHRIYTTSAGKEQIQDIAINEAATDNTKHGIEKPTQFTWRLRIKSIKVADEGKYECYVSVNRQSKVLDRRIIVVYIVPTLDPALTSTDMTVKEGDYVELTCNATGRPPPTIEWSRQGGALLPIGKEVHRDGKMKIESVRYNDRGVYFCDVFNIIGKEERRIVLDVKFKPVVTVQRAEIYQAVGYQIELQCFGEANPFPKENDGELKWTTPGGQSLSISTGGYEIKSTAGAFNRLTYEMIIKGVVKEDFGRYSCIISNSEGMTIRYITLKESDTPEKSIKLNRVIASASNLVANIITLLLAVCSFYIIL